MHALPRQAVTVGLPLPSRLQASQEGLIRRHSHAGPDCAELNLHSTTAGVALLSLHCWLQDLA